MKISVILHLFPLVFLTAGYISAYRLAQRSIENDPLKQLPSRTALQSARAMLVFMPLSGIFAAVGTWEAPALPLIVGLVVGGAMNVFYFFGSCRTIMANRLSRKP